jgi:hypothetical protein
MTQPTRIVGPMPSWHITGTAPWCAVARAQRWRPAFDDVVVTVDPALRCAGVALWVLDRDARAAADRVTFRGAWDVRNDGNASAMVSGIYVRLLDDPAFVAARSCFVIVEKMQHYRGKAARDASLEAVEAVTASLRSRFPLLADPWTAGQWKGQIPKDVHHGRVAAHLRTPCDGLGPDAMDAVGLGLYAFGVVGRGGVNRV